MGRTSARRTAHGEGAGNERAPSRAGERAPAAVGSQTDGALLVAAVCVECRVSRDAPARGAGRAGDGRQPGHRARDVARISDSLDRFEAVLQGRRPDVLVANAGLWPTRHAFSAQGHEIAFATNVLGHHALVQGAIDRGLLSGSARILVVTGDIYVMSSDCTADHRYRGAGPPCACTRYTRV